MIRSKFMVNLRLEISKLCRVRTHAGIEEVMNVAIEVEQVLGDLRGKILSSPSKRERMMI